MDELAIPTLHRSSGGLGRVEPAAVRYVPLQIGGAADWSAIPWGAMVRRASVTGISGKHEHPDFSEIVLKSLNWGKPRGTVQFGPSFSV